MTLDFVYGYNYENPVQIKVKERPTAEQYNAIDDFISNKLEYLNEIDEDITQAIFWEICFNAVSNHCTVVIDETIKTFYF